MLCPQPRLAGCAACPPPADAPPPGLTRRSQGRGQLKYGVEESYITHVDHTGEWAGKHFIGRKVRMPHLGPREIDKQGTIRGHNERRDEYTVLLENGRTVGQLKFEQMKVPYELIKR